MSYTAEELIKWWPAKCPECGWRGLSRDAAGGEAMGATGDFCEVVCPRCLENGFSFDVWFGGWAPGVEDDAEPETVAPCAGLPIQARLLGDGRQWWNVSPPPCVNCGDPADFFGDHPDAGHCYACKGCTVGQGFLRLRPWDWWLKKFAKVQRLKDESEVAA